MLAWISDNVSTMIICLVLALVVIAVIISIVKTRKKGNPPAAAAVAVVPWATPATSIKPKGRCGKLLYLPHFSAPVSFC